MRGHVNVSWKVLGSYHHVGIVDIARSCTIRLC